MYSVNKTKKYINSFKRIIYFRVIIANFNKSMKGCSYVKQQYVLLYLKLFLSHYSLFSVREQHSGNAEIFISTFFLKLI